MPSASLSTPAAAAPGDTPSRRSRQSAADCQCVNGRIVSTTIAAIFLITALCMLVGQTLSTVGDKGCQESFVGSAAPSAPGPAEVNGEALRPTSPPGSLAERACQIQGELPPAEWPFVNAVFDYLDASGVPWFAFGGWVFCLLRAGAISIRFEGVDYVCDNDLDIAVYLRNVNDTSAFFQDMRDHFARRPDVTELPPYRMWAAVQPAKRVGYEPVIVNAALTFSYDEGPLIRIAGKGPGSWYYPQSAVFPLRQALFNNRTVPVPRDPLRFFSFYRPYKVPASMARPEYGQGCMSLAYNPYALFKMLNITMDFSDESYSRIRALEKGFRECARNLDALGYASFVECFG